MKALILLMAVVLVGCGTLLTPAEREFVGSYERQSFFSLLTPYKFELLKNGRVKGLEPFKIQIRFTDLHKIFPPPLPKWKLVDGELHTTGTIKVFIINPDGSLTAMPQNETYRPHKGSDHRRIYKRNVPGEAAIRKAAGKRTGELTKADYEKVTKLDLRSNNLTEVPTGLEKLTQLTELNLYENRLTSVKGLENLTQLEELSLSENRLTSVTGLENLTQLRHLNLSDNQLTEVPKGLEKLTQLEGLSLRDNQLTDVKGLEKLTQLTVLGLFNNQLTDVKGLEKLKQLTGLYLAGNKLTDVKGLEKLKQLTRLNLRDNPDLTKAQISELQKALPNCRISSNPTLNAEESAKAIEAAIRKAAKKPTGELTEADLEKLTVLGLSTKQLTSVKGLEKLAKLKWLYLNGNQLTDVKGLEKLTQLTQLYLAYNQLTDVKGLENLTKLTKLYLSKNQLTEVKGLENLTQLEGLYLKDNPALTKAQIAELQKALPKCIIYSNHTK